MVLEPKILFSDLAKENLLGAGEVAPSVKCFFCKHGDKGWIRQELCGKKSTLSGTHSTGVAETRRSLVVNLAKLTNSNPVRAFVLEEVDGILDYT